MQQPSRSVGRLADLLRKDVLAERVPVGQLMQSERQLAAQHGVSPKTLRCALKILEGEGLIAAEERRGYRVLCTTGPANHNRPIAFIVSTRIDKPTEEFHRSILHELQTSAARHDWPLLGIIQETKTPEEIVTAIMAAGVWGAVIDHSTPDLLNILRKRRIPIVLAESWSDAADFDMVTQDSFDGGLLAGSWLAERGHKQVAFFSHSVQKTSRQVVERLGGAAAGLATHGAEIPRNWLMEKEGADSEWAYEQAFDLLSRPDRPKAILALWQRFASAVARAAGELGLVLGKDLDLVGWCPEESYESHYALTFQSTPVPPTITWSIQTLTELCIRRLMEREVNPDSPTSMTKVSVRLKMTL